MCSMGSNNCPVFKTITRGHNQGRIQDFQLWGGGTQNNGAERSEARKFLGVFRVKNHDFKQKKSNFFQF